MTKNEKYQNPWDRAAFYLGDREMNAMSMQQILCEQLRAAGLAEKSPEDFLFGEIVIPAWAACLLIEVLDKAKGGKKGPRGLSLSELVAYDVAIISAQDQRDKLISSGASRKEAKAKAIKAVRRSFPALSENTIARHLEQKDTGKPYR